MRQPAVQQGPSSIRVMARKWDPSTEQKLRAGLNEGAERTEN